MTSFEQPTKWKHNRWWGPGGHRCGDIEVTGYLGNMSGPVTLMLDLLITHERFGSSSDPSINGHLHYPNELDSPQNESVTDKIRTYRPDYNHWIFPLTWSPLSLVLLVRLGAYTTNLCVFYFYKFIGKLVAFLQFQEFSFRNLPVDSSTSVERCSPHSSRPKWVTSSTRLKHHILT
jgi:hypothetical protein